MWTKSSEYDHEENYDLWTHRGVHKAVVTRTVEEWRRTIYMLDYDGETWELVSSTDAEALEEASDILQDALKEEIKDLSQQLLSMGCTHYEAGHKCLGVTVRGKRDSFTATCGCGYEATVAMWYHDPLDGWQTEGWSLMLESGQKLICSVYGVEND